MNHINEVLKDLIKNIDQECDPRNLKVKETLFAQFKLDPRKTTIDYPSRPFNWKYFSGELFWYLLKDRKLDNISKYSSFWKKLTNIDGTVNSNYGHLFIGDQFKWAYECLENDKNTRQAVSFYNRPEYQYTSNKDFVCTLYNLFFIRDNKLHMKAQMRSSDLWYGISYDAPWFGTIQQSMFLSLKKIYPELELGYYHHASDNLHFYERHFDLSEKVLRETPSSLITMTLKEPLFEIEGIDVKLTGNTLEFISKMREADGQDVDYKKILSTLYEFTDEK